MMKIKTAILSATLLIAGLSLYGQTFEQACASKWVYKNIAYEKSSKTWYQAQDAKVTLTRLKGNCTDFAVALASILKANHYSEKPVLVICSVPWSKGYHAIVRVENGAYLDATNGMAYAGLPVGYKIIETHTL